MLSIETIRHKTSSIIQELQKRGIQDATQIIDTILELDKQYRATKTALEIMYNKTKQHTTSIAQLINTATPAIVDQAKKKAHTLKASIQQSKILLKQQACALQEKLYTLPNIPHETAPIGNNSLDNSLIEQKGIIPTLSSDALPHWELVKQYNLIDFEAGNKITGAGFPIYKGHGARLQRALINFFLDEAQKEGYQELSPPILVNEESGYATGQLPDKDGQMYQLDNKKFYLIPTAEVPMLNVYRNMLLSEAALPIQHVGYTPCFRQEAGSWGSDVRGLNRLHQFDKVELIEIQHPDTSYDAFNNMLHYVKKITEKLELPYRVLQLCSGDLGFTAACTYDIEVFSAGQKKWLEVSSISHCTTYQATRLKLRYKDAYKKTHLLHTLNGSALALPRVMAALLENNQTKIGITIPSILRPYTGFDLITAA